MTKTTTKTDTTNTTKKPRTRRAGTGTTSRKGQTQSAAAETAEPVTGGTAGVAIEIVKVPDIEYGKRTAAPEKYPFGELGPSQKNSDGSIVGPSFFIAEEDGAKSQVAAARKRHPFLIWTRKSKEKVPGKGNKLVEGLRIWRAPDDESRKAAQKNRGRGGATMS